MVLTTSLLLLLAPAEARTWTVATSGGDFSSIQAAINSASNGDTIQVSDGTWTGSIELGARAITLVSVNGADQTTIEGWGSGYAVSLGYTSGGDARIEGFTIRNGAAQGMRVLSANPELVDLDFEELGDGVLSGGALVLQSSGAALQDVRFTGGAAGSGAHVLVDGGAPTFQDCDFQGGVATSYGGAIAVRGGASVVIADSHFSENQADSGGAVDVEDASHLEMTDCVFEENTADLGGAVTVRDGSILTETRGAYSYNHAVTGGGAIYGAELAALTLAETVLSSNDTDYIGGAIHTSGAGPISWTDLDFSGNTALYYGGAAYIINYGARQPFDVTGTSFRYNSATYGSGGALFSYAYVALHMVDCELSSNSADDWGGGLYARGSALLENTLFEGNHAETRGGGGLWYRSYAGEDIFLEVADSTFTNNSTPWEGGGASVQYGWPATIRGTRFEGNSAGASQPGGGLFAFGHTELSVLDSEFLGNTAGYGGGALSQTTEDAGADTWTRVLFQQNLAGTGGGLAVFDTAQSSMRNTVFVGNVATDAGAALFGWQTWLALENSVVAYSGESPALWVDDDFSAKQAEVRWNAFHENSDGDLGGALDVEQLADTLYTDPGFSSWVRNESWEDEHFVLAADSPLIDAGHPEVLDPDGSVSDIGLWSGPLLAGAELEDGDGDGTAYWRDCDDSDATATPGNPESWYDGVNQDCAMGSDFDADRDGFESAAHGGNDCDDADPDIGAEDCADDTGQPADTGEPGPPDPQEPGGCEGCDATPIEAPLAALLLSLVAVRRRA